MVKPDEYDSSNQLSWTQICMPRQIWNVNCCSSDIVIHHVNWHVMWWHLVSICMWVCHHASYCSSDNANWCHCWDLDGHLIITWCYIQQSLLLRSRLLIFYFAFEVSIFPVIMMILLWGIQPERSSAFFYLMVYSVVASYPFLVCMSLGMSTSILLIHHSRSALFVALTLAFFVKLPIYLLHLWLPKAHVEAPSLGSIILAGLLLKLGAWGIFRLSWVTSQVSLSFFEILSIVGMVIGSALATLQSDGKRLVAYSSICHMNFLSLMVLSSCSLGKSFGAVIMLSHAITASLIFWITGMIYHARGSRQLQFLATSSSSSSSCLSLYGFVLFTNFGLPPTLSFSHELVFISVTMAIFRILLIILSIYLLVVCYFSLYYLIILTALSTSNATRGRMSVEETILLGATVWSCNILFMQLIILLAASILLQQKHPNEAVILIRLYNLKLLTQK